MGGERVYEGYMVFRGNGELHIGYTMLMQGPYMVTPLL